MGVRVERDVDAGRHDARHQIKPDTKEVIARGEKLARKPRVATYKPWQASMDEGWTRWLLDTYGVSVKGLSPQEVAEGR